MKKLIDISGIFIIIAFILSIYCFSLAINLTYRDYKLVDEQNKFNKNLKLVSLSYNKEEKI